MTATLDRLTPPMERDVPELMTGEELAVLGDLGRCELITGRLVYMSPTGHVHGTIESTIGALLREFVRERKLGRVMVGETGIYTKRMPDTVRAADVLFISRQRLTQLKSTSFLDVGPELAVEVLSPDDSWSGLSAKLDEYFAIGVEAVWVVDPGRRHVWVFTGITEMSLLTEADTLAGTGLLAEFRAPRGRDLR